MEDKTVESVKSHLRVLERILGWEFGDQSECCGLTNSQRTAMIEIGRRGRASLVDLAEVLGLDASSLSRTINGLVNIGLVRREIRAEDRRYITLTLTGQGAETHRRIEDLVDAYYGEVLARIPRAKHRGIVDSLGLLAGAVSRSGKSGKPCGVACAVPSAEKSHVRNRKAKS